MQYVYAADAASVAGPFVEKIKDAILYPLIALLMGVALLIFLWGVFRYISSAEGDEGRATGKRHMLFGIIGLVIMVSAVAILNIALATFGIGRPSGL
jgi:uncharacterized membrane protein YidH (DUF202 family)